MTADWIGKSSKFSPKGSRITSLYGNGAGGRIRDVRQRRRNARQIRKTQELDDKYQILRAELNAEIQQGLANVEKVGEQILMKSIGGELFRSVTLNFSPRLRIRYETSAIPLLMGGIVRVSGHTDDIPIAFSERFDSNWDLSAASGSGGNFFFANNAIDSERVSVFGYADPKPVADNSNAAGGRKP